jgi:hypothetical protein
LRKEDFVVAEIGNELGIAAFDERKNGGADQ